MEANQAIALAAEVLQVGEAQPMVAVVLTVAIALTAEVLQVVEVQIMVATVVGRVKLHRLVPDSEKPMVEGFCLFQQTFLVALSFPFAEFFFQDERFLLRFQTSL